MAVEVDGVCLFCFFFLLLFFIFFFYLESDGSAPSGHSGVVLVTLRYGREELGHGRSYRLGGGCQLLGRSFGGLTR